MNVCDRFKEENESGIFGSMKIFGYGIFKNKNSNVSEKEEITEETTAAREVYGLMIKSLLQKL